MGRQKGENPPKEGSERQRESLIRMSEQKKEAYLEKVKERVKAKRASETIEEREARKKKDKEAKKAKRQELKEKEVEKMKQVNWMT